MTRLEIYLISFVGLLIVIAAAGMYGHKLGAESVQTKWDKAVALQAEKDREQANKAVDKLENGNAKAKVVYRTITQIVDKLVDRPVYRNVCFDADGLRVANEALTGTLTPAAKPDKPMPRPPTADRRTGGFSVAKTD